MANIFIHIGAHKAASTAIQSLLRQNKEALSLAGFSYFDKDHPQSEMLHILVQAGHKKLQPSTLSRLASDLRSKFELLLESSPSQNLIFSDENFSGRMLGLQNTLYPFAGQIAQVAQEAFSGHSVHPLIILRRQDHYVESAFTFRLRFGFSGDMANFLGTIDPADLSWRKLVNAWEQRFGRENVTVRLFETLISEPLAARLMLSQYLKADCIRGSLPKRNIGLNPLLANLLLDLRNNDLPPSNADVYSMHKACLSYCDQAGHKHGVVSTEVVDSLINAALYNWEPMTALSKTKRAAVLKKLVESGVNFAQKVADGCSPHKLPEGVRSLLLAFYSSENTELCGDYGLSKEHAKHWAGTVRR